jgi:hypothetical protein
MFRAASDRIRGAYHMNSDSHSHLSSAVGGEHLDNFSIKLFRPRRISRELKSKAILPDKIQFKFSQTKAINVSLTAGMPLMETNANSLSDTENNAIKTVLTGGPSSWDSTSVSRRHLLAQSQSRHRRNGHRRLRTVIHPEQSKNRKSSLLHLCDTQLRTSQSPISRLTCMG